MPRPLRESKNRALWMRRVDLVTRYSNPDILRFLAQRGSSGAITPEIRDFLGVTNAHAVRLLHALEEVGLVRSSIQTGTGSGKGNSIRWYIRRSVVKKALEDLRAYVLDGK